ncbi:MAG: DUF192 domain-containing protein [Deltaproteobacteria bacterium]|nr:DUF192 domain-containing protein [Deltaproteobacteria bacterium]
MKKPPKFCCVPACIVLAASLAAVAAAPAVSAELSEYGNRLTTVMVKGVAVTAEVVQEPARLYLGLSHRNSLPQGRGMLFIMPIEEVQQFCMRGMRFAIDIIWIRGGRVAGCEKNIAADDARILTSPVPVKYVLEVPAGFCDRHRIGPSDEVSFQQPLSAAAPVR